MNNETPVKPAPINHTKVVYERQKAGRTGYCYFATPRYCLTLEELLAHAIQNHDSVKANKAHARSARVAYPNALNKHTSDMRIHSLAILRRSEELRQEAMAKLAHFDLSSYNACQRQANQTYKLKT